MILEYSMKYPIICIWISIILALLNKSKKIFRKYNLPIMKQNKALIPIKDLRYYMITSRDPVLIKSIKISLILAYTSIALRILAIILIVLPFIVEFIFGD